MESYMVEIDITNKDKLASIGIIKYESKLLKGLFYIKSELRLEEIKTLPFINRVNIEGIGNIQNIKKLLLKRKDNKYNG